MTCTSSDISPGCWITSDRFGPAVCIRVEEDHHLLRYKASHLATGSTIWVLNWADDCKFLRAADDESRHILTLIGPYGSDAVPG